MSSLRAGCANSAAMASTSSVRDRDAGPGAAAISVRRGRADEGVSTLTWMARWRANSSAAAKLAAVASELRLNARRTRRRGRSPRARHTRRESREGRRGGCHWYPTQYFRTCGAQKRSKICGVREKSGYGRCRATRGQPLDTAPHSDAPVGRVAAAARPERTRLVPRAPLASPSYPAHITHAVTGPISETPAARSAARHPAPAGDCRR